MNRGHHLWLGNYFRWRSRHVSRFARLYLLGDTHEVVRARGGADRVDGDLHGPRGAVLEADRARKARRELPVELRLGGARADGPPCDGVGRVLGGDGVQKLCAARDAHLVDADEELQVGSRIQDSGMLHETPISLMPREGSMLV